MDSDWDDRVKEYQQRQGHETRSEAVRDLIKTGYREQRSPLLYRAKQQSKDIAFYLPLVATTVVIIGQLGSVLAPQTAWQIGAVLVVMSIAPLAAVEGIVRALDRYSGREVDL